MNNNEFLILTVLLLAPAFAVETIPLPTGSPAPEAITYLDYSPGKAPPFWSVAHEESIMAREPDQRHWRYYYGCIMNFTIGAHR